MSEEATRQVRSPVGAVVREEATSHAGRWGHPSPATGQTTSPTPDQSQVGYLTEQVSPQPIRPGENEATLTTTDLRAHHQQAELVTTINIPQHPHHPHHKYQLLHGVTTDTQQQQHIIQHSSTVIQQQPQSEVTDQPSEDHHFQMAEEASQGDSQPQQHSPYTSTPQSSQEQHQGPPPPPPPPPPQEVSPYNTQQQETHNLATQGGPPQAETTAQATAPTAGRESDTPNASAHHPSTIKEVYITQGQFTLQNL